MKRSLVAGGIGVLLLFSIWTVLSLVFGNYLVPSPWISIIEAGRLLGTSFAWKQIGVTLLRVTAGFLSAFVVGTLVGMIASKPFLGALIKPLLVLMQGMPPILWAIPLILILGFGGLAPIVVIALICFPLIAVTVGEGMRTVPESLRGMLRIYANGPFPRIRELYIPHLSPFFRSALYLGLSLAIKASVVAEYFGSSNGLGFQIQTAYQAFQIKRLFGWSVILISIIVISDRLLRRLTRTPETAAEAAPEIDATDPSASDSLVGIREQFLHPSESNELVLDDVTFGYSRERPTVENISLRVAHDQIAVISGESGIGKTTLLSLCARLNVPSSGTVKVPGRLGFVFQDDRFLPWRSCLYNVALPLLYDKANRMHARSFAESMLREVGLIGYRKRLPSELSGGMKKRLAFARCFAALPEAIILDEPFSGLDADARKALWEKFADLLQQHPVPVVVVTHFPEEVPHRLHPRFYTMAGHPSNLSGPRGL